MLFNSFQFALFFLPVFAIYALLGHRWQNRFLLVVSYVFYGSWDWRFLSLILLSTVIDFCCGLALADWQSPRRKLYLYVTLGANLGLLGAFKYYDFFAREAADLLAVFGVSVDPFTLFLVLPVGISFYTFQTLSYTLDVYLGKIRPTRDFVDFALFVAFFPQLVAGPIEKSHNFLPQIERPRTIRLESCWIGSWLIFWGLFKKVVVADNLAPMVDSVFRGDADPSGLHYLVGAYAFAWQIYCDFSGYTDIARGLAMWMGFELMLNFRMPYLATNLSDFWRRWHISLSSWFKEYLYVPLGGNRRGTPRLLLNLMIVFLVSGLWHGAATNFVAWGALHGLGLVLLTLAGDPLRRIARVFPRRLWSGLAAVGTFHFVVLTFAIWQTRDVAEWIGMLHAIAFDFLPDEHAWVDLGKLVGLIAIPCFVQWRQARRDDPMVVLSWPTPARVALYATCLFLLLRFGAFEGEQFIYFQF